ncbi:MAG: molybdenum cofactor biosynthesis protein MoaE [Deltaproteobacteria bacterium]|nr:molybdenum cofactor biosynthesis protein MoaE [Deltaproteobacteria bacterium]
MRLLIVYLGGSRNQAGVPSEALRVEAGATVADVQRAIAALHPGLAALLPSVRWARNHQFVELSTALADGDEVAVLPPVSGGVARAVLTEAPLDVSEALLAVADPGVGATVLFVGTVRDQSRGKGVTAIEYQAYEPMAAAELERVAAKLSDPARRIDVRIFHRHGRLAVGEVAVVIAAAAPHREAAFEACRAAIEGIKKDVPIWKRETTEDGDTWVGWSGG